MNISPSSSFSVYVLGRLLGSVTLLSAAKAVDAMDSTILTAKKTLINRFILKYSFTKMAYAWRHGNVLVLSIHIPAHDIGAVRAHHGDGIGHAGVALGHTGIGVGFTAVEGAGAAPAPAGDAGPAA